MEKERKNGLSAGIFVLICLGVAAVLSVIAILFVREVFALNRRGREGEAITVTAEKDFDTAEAAVILKENQG